MMEANDVASMLVPVIMVLALGIVATIASRAMRFSPIIGFLLLGVLVGTWDHSLLASGSIVRLLAQLGVVFLLFDVGLHFSLEHVREQAVDIFGFGPAQVLAGAAALGSAAWLFGLPPLAAGLVGATLALSSTAVVANIIAERHQRTCPVGITATAILVFQDLVAIFLLILATADHSRGTLVALGTALLKAVAAFAMTVFAGKLIARPLFVWIARSGGDEVFSAVALVVAMAAAWAAAESGLSMTLGAFLGGMVVAESPFRTIVRSEIGPFRVLLLSFFFISVGATLDLRALASSWAVVMAIAAGLIALKIVTNALSALIFRWSVPGSLQLGFLIAQGSEFAFVIFGLPATERLIGSVLASELIAAVAVSLALTPALSAVGRQLAGRLRARATRHEFLELRERGEAGPVLIIGMGQIGRTIADGLTEFGIGYDAVERDERRLTRGLADGYHLVFGDAAEPRFWRAIDLHSRRFSVSTDATTEGMRDIRPAAETFYPGVRQVSVVCDEDAAEELRDLGMEVVIERDHPLGLSAARYLLKELSIASDEIERWSLRQRQLT